MTIRFSKRLDEIPGYKAGVPAGKAPEAIAAENIAQLASNESPWGPHPDVIAAIERRGIGVESEFEAMLEHLPPAQAMAVAMLAGRYVAHALVVNTLALKPPVASIFDAALV